MAKLYSVQINTTDCTKEIAVFCEDVTKFKQPIDILTTSAFNKSYTPTPHTVFNALHKIGINVSKLASSPAFDLRKTCNIWLSDKIEQSHTHINRVGCIELSSNRLFSTNKFATEESIINSFRAYFQMLDIASIYGVEMTTIALPLLGTGRQQISKDLLLTPLINECVSFLQRNSSVKNIYFIEIDANKAELISNHLKNSLRFTVKTTSVTETSAQRKLAFISYSSSDKNIADNLCAKLEQNGVKVWYAPRDVNGPYASAIVNAIDSADYFVVILSENSIMSEHVLNEIDLAFQNIPRGLKFKPLRIDNAGFTASFKYYLSRQHWMDATIPPLEERLYEFVNSIL